MTQLERWKGLLVVATLAVACGGTTDTGKGGGSGASAGGGTGGGSSGGGGGNGGVSEGGAAGAGGVAAAGGADGVSCLDASGTIPTSLQACGTDADCTMATVPRCCGSDLLTGMKQGFTCQFPVLKCGGLGCAKFVDPVTDDGTTVTPPAKAVVRCDQGLCRTSVLDSGPTPCGSSSCAAGELCIHPPTSVGGPQPLCVPVPDGGPCPPGTEYAQYCGGSGNGGCVEVYVPPPPYCTKIPANCGSPIDCTCIPQSLCGGGADFCQSVSGRDVTCVNLAP